MTPSLDELEALRPEIEKITGPCRCIPALKDRGLIDPSCVYHEVGDDIAPLISAAREGERMRAALEEIRDLDDSTCGAWFTVAEKQSQIARSALAKETQV